MHSRRAILIALLLGLPLLSWMVSTGGLPLCCWGPPRCANAAPMASMPGMPGMKDCAMGRHAPSCGMSASTPLSLPASLVPVAPLPARATGIPLLAPLTRLGTASLLPALPLALPAVFHPPNL